MLGVTASDQQQRQALVASVSVVRQEHTNLQYDKTIADEELHVAEERLKD